MANAKRAAFRSARQIPAADELDRVAWEHIEAVVRDPSTLTAHLREHWTSGTCQLEDRIATLQRDIRKSRNKRMALVRQHARGAIGEGMLDKMVAPLIAARTVKESELGTLLAQKQIQDAADDAEERIRECFALYVRESEHLD